MHTQTEESKKNLQSTAQTALCNTPGQKNGPKSYKTRKRKQKMHQKERAGLTHTLERTVAREEKLVLM